MAALAKTKAGKAVSAAAVERAKFLFDLNGYYVVRGVLTADEVSRANAAIDKHADRIKPRKCFSCWQTLCFVMVNSRGSPSRLMLQI